MKKLIPLMILLAGCGSTDDDWLSCSNVAHEYTYDITGETGLTLLTTTPEYLFLTFEEVEAEYIDLEACAVNTGTPGPYIELMDFRDRIPNYGYAVYIFAHLTVYLDTNPNLTPQRNCISDREYLRHEFMHHVLRMNGEDGSHANPKFAACDALGPKTCNGEYCE